MWNHFISRFCIFLLIEFSLMKAKETNNCRSNFPPRFDFIGANNWVLRDSAVHSTKALSRVNCARDCMIHPLCVSFNYFEADTLCELNNATRSQFPGSFGRLRGSFYFDNDRNTTLFLSEFASCKELLDSATPANHIPSGLYTIYPGGPLSDGLRVYCDMETDGGGWIVFQRRQDGTVDFYRPWADYQVGFGDLAGEFWLGNDNLRNLTENQPWEMRVDMGDWDGNAAWAQYAEFSITGNDQYILHVSGCMQGSTAGDSLLQQHDGMPFSTLDRDNDKFEFASISELSVGAWWYNSYTCNSNLNGVYSSTPAVDVLNTYQGLQWRSWKGPNYSLKNCSMKIREISTP